MNMPIVEWFLAKDDILDCNVARLYLLFEGGIEDVDLW
jgi:hypothetical protein